MTMTLQILILLFLLVISSVYMVQPFKKWSLNFAGLQTKGEELIPDKQHRYIFVQPFLTLLSNGFVLSENANMVSFILLSRDFLCNQHSI
jgi:hypothetical protein